jgi:alkanesulfonate monooxygenase SsuD/methylene tetrahydromethanopterin reductase-like flavin-dependent oxidoreductase (luciferase family)
MRIGVSLRSSYANVEARQGARWMIERAAAARDAGLDSLFVGDHHNVPVPYYQNVPMLGRLLAEWDDRPAGALFLLPLWHPVLAAEQIGTLAAIAQGRFIIQCALGADEAQFAALGASLRTRPSRFEHALDVIRRLCAGETVDGVRIAPVPPEPLEVCDRSCGTPRRRVPRRTGNDADQGPRTHHRVSRTLRGARPRTERDRDPARRARRRDA